MALPHQKEIKEDPAATQYTAEEGLTDRPLNLYPDQVPDIDPQIRKLNLELAATTTKENLGLLASAVLVGGALGFLWKRKYLLASNCLLAFLIQRVLFRQGRSSRYGKEREDLEIERYALKAQRGDYGKMEVIPFK